MKEQWIEKRKVPRVYYSSSDETSAILFTRKNLFDPIEVELLNLGLGGFCAKGDKKKLDILNEGDIIAVMDIDTPNSLFYINRLDAQVCHSRQAAHSKDQVVGCSFSQLTEENQKKIRIFF